jgi:hypothetical protein
VRQGGERRADVAPSEAVLEGHVGVADAGQVLEVGESGAGAQLAVQDRGARLRRLDGVEHGR